MIPVLDKGFVRLEAAMGGDQGVLRAARVSFRRGGADPAPDEERDRKLIAYLLAHQHGTPFEHAAFTFHVKCPIFVMRQWIRHRMSSYNETSFRYRECPEEFYKPLAWRKPESGPAANKQGSVGRDEMPGADAALDVACATAYSTYQDLLRAGVAREMARMVLPVNLYTEFYWTVNARALMHFIGLRSESHAQWETRQYSDAIAGIFQEQMPVTARAFLKELDPERYPILKQEATA